MDFIKKTINIYLAIIFGFLLLLLLVKVFESTLLSNVNGFDFWNINTILGLFADLQIQTLIFLFFFPFYFVLSTVYKKLSIFVTSVFFSFNLTLQVLLVFYFNESLTPLSYGNLKGMSNQQVLFIVELYDFSLFDLIYPVLLIVLISLLLTKSVKWFNGLVFNVLSSFLLVLSLIGFAFFPIKDNNFKNEIDYEIVQNKPYFFMLSYFEFVENQSNIENLNYTKELEVFYKINNIKDKEYYKYPFYSERKVRNPLGNFFVKQEQAPNIVFIISESLGRLFSGKNSRLGSFTPFLDSLAENSLYWENIIANAERTFGAIPNFMGGVPEGEEGFLNLTSNMPRHMSLPMLLKENNEYQTNFYCGAWKKFDNMEDYLAFQKFDNINGKSVFSENLEKKEIEKENGDTKSFNWGAEDATVFQESLSLLDSSKNNKPYFNLYLTTSFHKPFAYSNELNYKELARQNILKLHKDKQAEYLNQIETFAALLYADDCLRNFFADYQLREEFENTIFVISGDHAVKFMSENSRFEKYHVPLLIYSPLLIRTENFKSMACQKDVPSSLQGLLLNNFNLNLPKNSISISDNLDTMKEFSTKGSNFPLMYADKRLNNYVFGNWFYADGMIFKIESNMTITRFENDIILKEMVKRIENYKLLSAYTCKNNLLVPESNYNQFISTNFILDQFTGFDYWSKYLKSIYVDVQWTDDYSYSSKHALTNNGEKYLTLLKGLNYNSSKRVRLKINFNMFSQNEIYPSLYMIEKAVRKKDGKEELVSKTMATIGGAGCRVETIKNSDWVNFEGYMWVEPKSNSKYFQNLSAYLFFDNNIKYYIDDLSIQIEEF